MKNLTTKLITAITAAALLTCGIAACRPNIIQDPDPKKISDSESKETSEPSQPSDTWIEEPPTTVTDVTFPLPPSLMDLRLESQTISTLGRAKSAV